MQILAVDESKVYSPPSKLHLPEAPSTNSDSALSLQEDSDMSSSASSSPSYSHDGGDRQVWCIVIEIYVHVLQELNAMSTVNWLNYKLVQLFLHLCLHCYINVRIIPALEVNFFQWRSGYHLFNLSTLSLSFPSTFLDLIVMISHYVFSLHLISCLFVS